MDNKFMTIANMDNVATLDSRKVAEMVNKRHADLIRDIDRYVGVISENQKLDSDNLTNAKLRSSDFFIENTYVDKKGENRRCYDITKQGCEMIANKLTGEKGILFTAQYVSLFNEMEALHKPALPDFTNPVIAARAWADEVEQKQKALALIEEQKPAVIFAGAVSTSDTSILIGELAKVVKQNGVDMGQRRLFAWMRENGYLMKSGSSKNMPTQRAMEMKLFEIKEGSYVNGSGVNVITRTTKVTGKGQIYFINKLLSKAVV